MTASRAVLVVEDESVIAHGLQQSLIDLGYDAFAIAGSAEEAVARATERRPAVALVDVRIKGRLDGIKTAQLLQERFGSLIVYVAGHSDDATRQRALRTDPCGYLVKPVERQELRRAIQIAFSRHAEVRMNGFAVAHGGSAVGPARSDVRAPGSRAVRREVERLLDSPDFDAPRRSREFLRFVVEETLAGRADSITQGAIAEQVFGRGPDFDAMVDPIVRIQAGRLRRSLERYYLLAGKDDLVRIELPKGTYVPTFHVSEGTAESARRALALVPVPAPPALAAPRPRSGNGWPSVVVGGFDAPDPGGDWGDLALEVSEELALELGRYPAVHVLRQGDLAGTDAPSAGGARFALGGRLRRDGKDVRITARLVDRATGEQVWGDEYHTTPQPDGWSGSPRDVTRVIAARVAAEEGVIVQHLAAERRGSGWADPTAYDAILLSYEFFRAQSPETLRVAVQALRQVVSADPDCGLAWTRLARLHLTNYSFEVTGAPTPIEEAMECADHGVRVDPASRTARCMMAVALLLKGELAAARDELDRALRSSPGSLVGLEVIASLLALVGEWERGQALGRSARERNPHCGPHVLFGMWADGLRRGAIDEAYQYALEYRDPMFFWRPMMRAACLGLLGRTVEARSEVRELLARKPEFSRRGRVLIGHYIKFPEVMDRIVTGLAKAGLELA